MTKRKLEVCYEATEDQEIELFEGIFKLLEELNIVHPGAMYSTEDTEE